MKRLLLCLASLIFLTGADMSERDEKVIKALVDNGSDVSKAHLADFFLDFETFESAAPVARGMKENDFDVRMFENEDGTFTIEAQKSVIPSLENMTEISELLEDLTQAHGGNYDGWGTEVVE